MSANVKVNSPSTPNTRLNTTTAKPALNSGRTPSCAYCAKPIDDVVVQALGLTWHQDHFLCAHCQKSISSQKYHVHGDKPYCDKDYKALFLKKCFTCGQPIKDVVVIALGKSWHREHFTCHGCSTVLSHNGFYERESRPFCEECYENTFCPSCVACSKPIVDTAVLALGDKYHVDCFRCGRCGQPVMDGVFKVTDSKPICEKCYSG